MSWLHSTYITRAKIFRLPVFLCRTYKVIYSLYTVNIVSFPISFSFLNLLIRIRKQLSWKF